jgi:hypothetical protein
MCKKILKLNWFNKKRASRDGYRSSCKTCNKKTSVLYFNTDNNITILNNQPILTLKTLFTQDQELVTKKYVDDAIPPINPFNQSLNTTDNVIFRDISSYLDTGTLKFNELYPKSFNDLNIDMA